MHHSPNDGTTCVPVSEAVLSSPALKRRLEVRRYTAEDWVDQHGSGTLRKNKRLGFAWRDQYLQERVCFEFGWPFVCVPRTRVEWGAAITEGDCHALTEAGWHIDRMFALWPYPEDVFEVKHITVEEGEKITRGVGVVVRQTSASWVPSGHLVCGIVAEYREGRWMEATPL